MLIAELHGKLKGSFACSKCGNDEAMDLEAAAAVEDALTSSVLGALRYLPPELGVAPLLRRLNLDVGEDVKAQILPWPRHAVRVLRVEEPEPRDVGCEPDIVIDAGASLVVIEAKLGAALGGEPMQLPQEAIVAHRLAAGRPWRLLCVTAHPATPRIHTFRCEGGLVRTDALGELGDAVASYFEAARQAGQHEDWPTPDAVRQNTGWLSWHGLATLLEAGLHRGSSTPNAAALLRDVLALLRKRELHADPFRGFQGIPARELLPLTAGLWIHQRTQRSLSWCPSAAISAWPAGRWLLASGTHGGQASLFATLPPTPEQGAVRYGRLLARASGTPRAPRR